MNSCSFCISSSAAQFPTPPTISGGKPPFLTGKRRLNSLLPAKPTAFASPLSLPLRTRAFTGDCLALLEVNADVVATARPPDPLVLLLVSVLFLSLYIVANFVVPSYVSKYLGFDKAGDEDSNPEDEDNRSNG